MACVQVPQVLQPSLPLETVSRQPAPASAIEDVSEDRAEDAHAGEAGIDLMSRTGIGALDYEARMGGVLGQKGAEVVVGWGRLGRGKWPGKQYNASGQFSRKIALWSR